MTVTYRKHHSSEHQLKTFVQAFKEMCEKVRSESPYSVVHLGDLNARNSNWWHGDSDNEAGRLLNDVFDDIGLAQMVHEPTHILNNSKSCIDLVLTDQPNIISE